jgi:hypothetical protein
MGYSLYYFDFNHDSVYDPTVSVVGLGLGFGELEELLLCWAYCLCGLLCCGFEYAYSQGEGDLEDGDSMGLHWV